MGAYFQTHVIRGKFVPDCRYKIGARVAPLLALLLCFAAARPVVATTLLFKDGRALEGPATRKSPAWPRIRSPRKHNPAKCR